MPFVDELLKKQLPDRVRCNHALEHATLHVLQEQRVTARMGGISDANGFLIYGEIPTETILKAAQEGQQRLAKGETDLAVHPNCGTNLAVGGLAAGGLAWLGMSGTGNKLGKKLRRLPIAVLLGMIGYQVARPYGPKVQEMITTNADVEKMEIVEVVKHDVMGYTVHRVATKTKS